MSSKKSRFGQFFTTNYSYILQNMTVPDNVETIIEPFAGNKDLLKFIDVNKYNVVCYDIDPCDRSVIEQDTLIHPPDYNNTFILTNPPYLARNKNKDKTIYDKYNCNDLYKCFIKTILICDKCLGGIMIIPLNFISSIRKNDIELRKQFITRFNINVLNIFEERVFDDTSYTVCCMQFTKSSDMNSVCNIQTHVYPTNKRISLTLTSSNNYTVGGELYMYPTSDNIKVERATKHTKKELITNILLKAIDDSATSKIRLEMVDDIDPYIDRTPNLSNRSYAALVVNPPINKKTQNLLVARFNEFINHKRYMYNSLFLTNYRESNTIARKRISFEFAFNICTHLLSTEQ